MKALLVLIFLHLTLQATDPYDTSHCKDPEQLQTWAKVLADNPNDDSIQALHAMWVGLCLKVESKQITTNNANRIFDRAKEMVIDAAREAKKQQKESEGEKL
jgi:hypothetical protein